MKKLAIFDLDGTLLNTIGDLAAATNHALAKNGYPEHSIDEYRYFVGNGVRKLVERALPEESRNDWTIGDVLNDFLIYYKSHIADRSCPYCGICDTLMELHNMGIALAVASNKYQNGTESLIKHFFSEIPFAVVLGQREGVPVKPDPTIVFDILKNTNVAAQETIYIGDSGVDMQTANNSGVFAVGVLWGFRTKDELLNNGANAIAEQPTDILKYIS